MKLFPSEVTIAFLLPSSSIACRRLSGLPRIHIQYFGVEEPWPYAVRNFDGRSDLLSSTSPKLLRDSISRFCYQDLQCYEEGDRRLQSLEIDPVLSREQLVTVATELVQEAGSMVALSFLNWAVAQVEFRYFRRLYITTASALIDFGNLERANEVMRLMVKHFAEAVDMVIEMGNRGLLPDVHNLNCILRITADMRLWKCLVERILLTFVLSRL